MQESSWQPLISASDLLAILGHPGVRIADVRWFLGEPDRGLTEYRAGHIPGAVFVDLDRDLAAPPGAGRHPLPDPTAFADRLSQLGFGDEHRIVIYDGHQGQYGARLWWMLDRLGHPATSMLDGGLAAWSAAGGPLSVETPSPIRASLTLATEWPGVIDRQGVIEQADAIDLVDVRTPERYTGMEEPIERVAGHIPGARNRPCATMLRPDGRLLPGATLGRLLRGAGPRAELPLVVSCGSGVTACFGLLAARLAGLPDPILYPGSYSDWVGAGMPVVTGEEPGCPGES